MAVTESLCLNLFLKADADDEESERLDICPCLSCCPKVRGSPPDSTVAKGEGGCMNWFKYVLQWILFIPSFPFLVAFSWTIPDCSKPHNK